MISLSICLFEMFYWMLTGGHCFGHLAEQQGAMACSLIVPLELFVEIMIIVGINLWRDK